MPTINVDVDVSLGDFETSDLVDELASRGDLSRAIKPEDMPQVPPLHGEERHPLHEIYYALKFGLREKAIDLMRDHINEQLGTAL